MGQLRSGSSMWMVQAAAAALGALAASPLYAATLTWTGAGTDTQWTTAGNWDADAVPAMNDNVVISFNDANSHQVDFNTTETVSSLCPGAWTPITNSGTGTVTLNFNGGRLDASGAFGLGDGATINVQGAVLVNWGATLLLGSSATRQATLNVTSGQYWAPAPTAEYTVGAWGYGAVNVSGSGYANFNQSGVSGGLAIGKNYGAGSANGTMTLSGNGQVVNGGALSLGTNNASSGGSAYGTVTISGGTWTNAGNVALGVNNGGATCTAQGTLNISGGTFTVGTTSAPAGLTVGTGSSANITGGSATITGDVTCNTGSTVTLGLNQTLAVSGDLVLNGTDTLDLTGTPDGVSSYTLATYSGLTGNFVLGSAVPNGYALNVGNQSITLTPVPEPASLGLLALGGLLGLRRRR